MDQDSAFMSTLMNYLLQKLNIKIMTVALYNHQSLQAEHGIKMLSQILTKHLSGQGQMRHKYLPLVTFAQNTFNSPNLANHSPYELVFGRKPKLLLDLETDPDVRVSGTKDLKLATFQFDFECSYANHMSTSNTDYARLMNYCMEIAPYA